jgi:mRNA interferase MazF
LKRGDIVIAVFQGDYGKPRPAVIIQGDIFAGSDSVLVCQFTSDNYRARFRRIPVEPSLENGLKVASQIMVDKIFAVRRDKCGGVIGRLDNAVIDELDVALALMIGLVGN